MKFYVEIENRMYEFVENFDEPRQGCQGCPLDNRCNNFCIELEDAMEEFTGKIHKNYFFKEVKKT